MVLFSLFKGKAEKDTAALLEDIENKIKEFKEERCTTTVRKISASRKILYYGVGFYAVALGLTYINFPSSIDLMNPNEVIPIGTKVLSILIGVPVFIYLLRRLCVFYYERKYKIIDKDIKKIEKEKDTLINNVMEKEPYNKAREILKKYKPSLLKNEEPVKSPTVRRRAGPNVNSAGPKKIAPKLVAINPQAPSVPSPIQRNPQQKQHINQGVRQRPQTVRPLPSHNLNSSRMDKIVGWMTGSSPDQMYALICKQCAEHNGLSPKEEFDYLQWRCAFCGFNHLPRKQRPKPPILQEQRPADRPIFNSSAVEPRRKTLDSDYQQKPIENANQTMPVLADGERSKRGSIASSKSDGERKEKEDSGTESDQLEQNQRNGDENSTSTQSISSSDEEEIQEEVSKESVEAESSVLDETIEAGFEQQE